MHPTAFKGPDVLVRDSPTARANQRREQVAGRDSFKRTVVYPNGSGLDACAGMAASSSALRYWKQHHTERNMCLPSCHCSASIRTATLESRYRTVSYVRPTGGVKKAEALDFQYGDQGLLRFVMSYFLLTHDTVRYKTLKYDSRFSQVNLCVLLTQGSVLDVMIPCYSTR